MTFRRVLSLALLGSIVLSGCIMTRHRQELISQFDGSQIIQPDKSGRRWDAPISLPFNITLSLRAETKSFGNAVIQYSDENKERIVYQYGDYLYVQEIRISSDKQKLFVKVSGSTPKLFGSWGCTLLKVYDLVNRNPITTIEWKESETDAHKVPESIGTNAPNSQH